MSKSLNECGVRNIKAKKANCEQLMKVEAIVQHKQKQTDNLVLVKQIKLNSSNNNNRKTFSSDDATRIFLFLFLVLHKTMCVLL